MASAFKLHQILLMASAFKSNFTNGFRVLLASARSLEFRD